MYENLTLTYRPINNGQARTLEVVFGAYFFNQLTMPKFKDVDAAFHGSVKNEMRFKYTVSIDSDGYFYAYLPDNIVTLVEAHIKLDFNPSRKKIGYYSAQTFDELCKKIAQDMNAFLSRELVEEKIVIEYCITTECSYVKMPDGDFAPNGDSYFGKGFDGFTEGTLSRSYEGGAYGFTIYARPFLKRVYKFKTGTEVTKYENLIYEKVFEATGEPIELDYGLKFLLSTVGSKPFKQQQCKVIDYTPEIAIFFVNMYKSLFGMNEKIKDMLEPETISLIAQQQFKALM